MKYATICLMSAAGLSMAGCVPLQQAPLVYTSAVSIGLKVGTDTAKPEISIGLDQVDAAYVPVAVAKPCPADTGRVTDCNNDLYRLALVTGRNVANSMAPPSSPAVTAVVNVYTDAKTKADNAKKAFDDATNKLATDQAQEDATLNPLQAKLDAAAAGTPEQTAAAQALANAKASLAALDTKIGVEKKTLADAQKTLNDANDNLAAKLREMQDIVSGGANGGAETKFDAFSVYGTFSSDTHADSPSIPSGGGTAQAANASNGTSAGGAISAAKSFSAGIAAQNLTEGLRESARPRAITECLAEANKFYTDHQADVKDDATTKASLLVGLVAACNAANKTSN